MPTGTLPSRFRRPLNQRATRFKEYHTRWDRNPEPRDLRKAMALRSEDVFLLRSTDRAPPPPSKLPHTRVGVFARSLIHAQNTDGAPGFEHTPRGLKPYEANASQCNSERRVAFGHGRRPKAL